METSDLVEVATTASIIVSEILIIDSVVESIAKVDIVISKISQSRINKTLCLIYFANSFLCLQ